VNEVAPENKDQNERPADPVDRPINPNNAPYATRETSKENRAGRHANMATDKKEWSSTTGGKPGISHTLREAGISSWFDHISATASATFARTTCRSRNAKL
jgi:hypothetical protein